MQARLLECTAVRSMSPIANAVQTNIHKGYGAIQTCILLAHIPVTNCGCQDGLTSDSASSPRQERDPLICLGACSPAKPDAIHSVSASAAHCGGLETKGLSAVAKAI